MHNPDVERQRLYSIKQAACYLGISVSTLRRLVWGGKLPFIKWGSEERGVYHLDIQDLDMFINENKQQNLSDGG